MRVDLFEEIKRGRLEGTATGEWRVASDEWRVASDD